MKITFLGAAGTVTGSKYLIQSTGAKVLVDCGMFQGQKALRLHNWDQLPFRAQDIDACVLTHAHIDHSGYIPVLVKRGFKGKIYCSQPTFELCEILLRDSGKLQEEDAEYANRKGFSRHKPALPLYTEQDAIEAMRFFSPIPLGKRVHIANDMEIELTPAGHILGASMVTLSDGHRRIVFTGDLGRNNDLTMLPPRWIKSADYLVLESTYGNRLHTHSDLLDELEAVINRTVKRNGNVIIPAFSVGRTQNLLFALSLLKKSQRIPEVPIFLNSPMAISATDIFCRYPELHRLDDTQCQRLSDVATFVHSVEDSKALDQEKGPMVIISASGMATGGRVLHHIRQFAPDPKNTLLFTGFQAAGTRGRDIVSGAREIKIHGQIVPINAEVVQLDNLSAHADQNEILLWLSHFKQPPKKTFLVHGEPLAAAELQKKIIERYHWDCVVPQLGESDRLS